VTDNIALNTPGWGYVHVLAKTDGLGNFPKSVIVFFFAKGIAVCSWGNWAVVYNIRGTVLNTGLPPFPFRLFSPLVRLLHDDVAPLLVFAGTPTRLFSGKATRTFEYYLTAPGDSPVASRAPDGTWGDFFLHTSERTRIYALPVPPSSTPHQFCVTFVLGGPGYGALVDELAIA